MPLRGGMGSPSPRRTLVRPGDRIRCLQRIRRTRPLGNTLTQGTCPHAVSRRASPIYPLPRGIHSVGGVYGRRRSAPYRYVETSPFLGGLCSAVYSALRDGGSSVGGVTVSRRHAIQVRQGANGREYSMMVTIKTPKRATRPLISVPYRGGGGAKMAVCSGTKHNGEPCTVSVPHGERYRYNHNLEYAEERRASPSRAATVKHSSVARELRGIRELIWEFLELTITDQLSVMVRRRLDEIVQLLQCYLRAAELEMRLAEEPLRSYLDVAGLKAQVLGRIEELEARECEREEILSELVPAMEARRYDAGALRAVIGG